MTNQDLETQVKALLKEGKTLSAVRLVQKTRQCGLKEAKDYVDKIIDELWKRKKLSLTNILTSITG